MNEKEYEEINSLLKDISNFANLLFDAGLLSVEECKSIIGNIDYNIRCIRRNIKKNTRFLGEE